MTRWLSRSVAAVSIVTAAACASSGSVGQVKITTSQNLVSKCQEIGEVAVSSWTRDDDVLASLDSAARRKGADFVLLKADGARSGVAYRCGMPVAGS